MGKKDLLAFFEFFEKFFVQLLLEIIWNENLCCYCYFITNPIFCKIMVVELWVKLLPLNQIAGFFKISGKKWKRKFIFAMHMNIKVFFLIISSFWVCKVRYLQSSQNKKFAYLRNISGKTWAVKLCFFLQINTSVFYKLIVSLWECVARHAESMKTNIFARSL